jgi:hypothetical protein
MGLEELKELKRTQYEEARKSGVFQRLATVGGELGREVGRPGPKYLWEESGVRVFVDDYGGHVTAHANEKACSLQPPVHSAFCPWPEAGCRSRPLSGGTGESHTAGRCKVRDRETALAV